MKLRAIKLLAIAAMAVMSNVAQADQWQLVAESVSGSKIYVNDTQLQKGIHNGKHLYQSTDRYTEPLIADVWYRVVKAEANNSKYVAMLTHSRIYCKSDQVSDIDSYFYADREMTKLVDSITNMPTTATAIVPDSVMTVVKERACMPYRVVVAAGS